MTASYTLRRYTKLLAQEFKTQKLSSENIKVFDMLEKELHVANNILTNLTKEGVLSKKQEKIIRKKIIILKKNIQQKKNS